MYIIHKLTITGMLIIICLTLLLSYISCKDSDQLPIVITAASPSLCEVNKSLFFLLQQHIILLLCSNYTLYKQM